MAVTSIFIVVFCTTVLGSVIGIVAIFRIGSTVGVVVERAVTVCIVWSVIVVIIPAIGFAVVVIHIAWVINIICVVVNTIFYTCTGIIIAAVLIGKLSVLICIFIIVCVVGAATNLLSLVSAAFIAVGIFIVYVIVVSIVVRAVADGTIPVTVIVLVFFWVVIVTVTKSMICAIVLRDIVLSSVNFNVSI